ncbi:MAG: NAD(P)/FAD-dependent oxidoreductase [Alphaproteobacteria bacterium]|nr:NAD(P)/FAD-dependent oxidoreductase [Alphaproteobacteria bacterium]
MRMKSVAKRDRETVAIVGAGPAGMTAAYQLQSISSHYSPIVFEAGHLIGGIARTESHNGFRFDIGGHRFFTKAPEVEDIWNAVLGDDLITVPRLSRIYYKGRYFDYPLKLLNALWNTGPYEAIAIVLSYARWRLRPHPVEETFEQWVINRFGARLYNHFFRSYTQKVWGIPPNQIRADWAAQRIKDLSLLRAIGNALGGTKETTSLIEQFKYPRLGPGMMWERMGDLVQSGGGSVKLNHEVVRVLRDGTRVDALDIRSTNRSGEETLERVKADHFINSAALDDLVEMFDPPAPQEVRAAARRLKYRDFVIVTLILDRPDPFPDNWIYVHDPNASVGRIQNFRAWSPDMLPNQRQSSIGMEYFCNQDDALWRMDDDELARLASNELESLGLAEKKSVTDWAVIRQKKAYPVYDAEYASALQIIQAWLNQLENFQTVGRNGLHRYNNQDHSMLTAILAARNIAGENHDLWNVNVERSYQEEFQLSEQKTTQCQVHS